MTAYLIKSLLCLLVLFGFYRFFLEAENMHRFKRFFLIGSVILACVLPLITFSYTVEYAKAPEMPIHISEFAESGPIVGEENWYSYLRAGALVIYFIGVLVMGFRFFKNLYSIQKAIKNNHKLKNWNYIYVLLKEKLVPHTFLNYIFLAKTEFENDLISESVIEHEKAHVDQKHSVDILFIEMLQVVFWFNPVFIWLKRSVKLNHEFLADQQVLENRSDALEYSNVLLRYGSALHHNSLSSSISNSLIKKRIIMISKSFSLKRSLSRIGFLLPVLALCIYFFNNDIVAKPVIKTTEAKEALVNTVEIQDPDIISIRLEKDRIFVNNTQVKLNAFASHLDDLVEDKSDAQLKEMNFRMQTQNAEEGLLKKLNSEFEKTRFSKVTGHSVLPPPPPSPPAPASLNDVPPPPPPATETHRSNEKERAEMREHLRQERVHLREQMNREREQLIAEREAMSELRDKYRQEELTEEQKKAIQAEMKAKRAELAEKTRMIERKHIEMQRAHRETERAQKHMRHPKPPKAPIPPDPIEMINKINSQGGSFYHNGEKISADKAREILKKNKDVQIRINDNNDDKARFEINDN